MKVLFFFDFIGVKSFKKLYTRFKTQELKTIIQSLNRNSDIQFYCLKKSEGISKIGIKWEINDVLREYLKIDREEYKRIVNNVWFKIKEIYNNLISIKLQSVTFFWKILEVYIKRELNDYLEIIEYIKSIINREKPDRVIFSHKNQNIYSLLKKEIEPSISRNCVFIQSKIDHYFYKFECFKDNIYELFQDFIFFFRKKTNRKEKKEIKNVKDVGIIIPRSFIYANLNLIFEELKKNNISTNIIYPSFFHFSKEYRDFKFKYINTLKFYIKNRKYWHLIKIKERIVRNLEPELKDPIFYILRELFFNRIIEILYWYDSIKKEINNRNYKLIIIGNEFYAEVKTFYFICKKYQIPMYFIPTVGIPDDGSEVTPYYCDFITVEGEIDKDFLSKNGVNSNKIYVRGSPEYENIFKTEIKEFHDLEDYFSKKKYTLSHEKTKILLTTNPITSTSNEFLLKTVIDVVKKLENIQFIIKLHPRENGFLHKKIIKNMNLKAIIVKNVNIFEIINSSDILITQDSRVILDAMIVGKPLIVLDLMNKRIYFSGKYQFNDEKYVKKAYNKEELYGILTHFLNNPKSLEKYKEKLRKTLDIFLYNNENYSPIKQITSDIKRIINGQKIDYIA